MALARGFHSARCNASRSPKLMLIVMSQNIMISWYRQGLGFLTYTPPATEAACIGAITISSIQTRGSALGMGRCLALYLRGDRLDFYTSKAWGHKREKILRRDGYMCRECRRYGRNRAATTVHHIVPYEERPDLALTDNNLISLCAACHNKKHPEKGGHRS